MISLDLSPEKLLPHEHPMILIDEIIDYSEYSALALVTPDQGKPFADQDGNVPSWVGMEYMAQTIGAYAGIRAQLAEQAVKIGFLLGTRSYEIDTDQFHTRKTYAIRVKKTYEDSGLNAFDCTISLYGDDEQKILAKATINTFQPDDVDKFMEGSKG